jgi:16S rRNA (cytosine967-C5)-methyltransferase
LARAANLVRPGGRIAYVTCSVLPAENDDRIAAFHAAHPGFSTLQPHELCVAAGLPGLGIFASAQGLGIQLSPRRSGTDGFYVSVMRRDG